MQNLDKIPPHSDIECRNKQNTNLRPVADAPRDILSKLLSYLSLRELARFRRISTQETKSMEDALRALDTTHIRPGSFVELQKQLKMVSSRCKNLKSVRMWIDVEDSVQETNVARIMAQCKKLASVDRILGGVFTSRLVPRTLPNLRTLCVQVANQAHIDAIARTCPELRALKIGHSVPFGSSSIGQASLDVTPIINRCSLIERLEIFQFDPDPLFTHFHKLEHLQSLAIYSAVVQNPHCTVLASQVTPKLRELVLATANVTERGLARLAKKFANIEVLDVEFTAVSKEGLGLLLDVPTVFPKLTRLLLRSHLHDHVRPILAKRKVDCVLFSALESNMLTR